MQHKPMIGLTPGYDYEKNQLYVRNGYYKAIIKAGGLPVILPPMEDEDSLADLVDRCEGFLLTGGPDIDAKYFGEPNLPCSGDISPYRDQMEIFIIRKAVALNKPMLGICRGIQVMNVALGGSIYQDIHSQLKDRTVLKHSQAAPVWYPSHEIEIEKNSRVWQCFMKERARVNTFHHQAVKDLAPGFIATSKTSDELVESIEHTNYKFAVGVQWHPELMWQEDDVHLGLFKQLVAACCDKNSQD